MRPNSQMQRCGSVPPGPPSQGSSLLLYPDGRDQPLVLDWRPTLNHRITGGYSISLVLAFPRDLAIGDAARSLGKDGLRMKSDDNAAAAVAADDAVDTSRLARNHEAAYIQKYEVCMHEAVSVAHAGAQPGEAHADGAQKVCMEEMRRAMDAVGDSPGRVCH